MRRLLIILGYLLGTCAGTVHAHFDLNGQHRIVIFDRTTSELFLRIPAPLVFAEALSRRTDPAAPVTAAFIAPVKQGGRWGHRLDTQAITANPEGFMAKIAVGYLIAAGDHTLKAEPFAFAVHERHALTPFATPDEARTALKAPNAAMPWVGDAVVEIGLRLPEIPQGLTIGSRLPEIALPPNVYIDNHLFDWRGGGVIRTSAVGQLTDPVTLERTPLRQLAHMVWEGIRHILEGLDHVLFVLCLTLGAGGLRRLLWAVTGFTLGHSVTLSAGFLGFVPAAPWFVPAVETAIAASIILTGILALTRPGKGPGFLLTAGLGMLHGFGFAFVLGNVLGRQAPDLIQSLFAFNLGVEIGQLAIVVIVFAALTGLKRLGEKPLALARMTTASVATGLAVIWMVERIELFREVI
jgi:hypothetical protein